MGKKYEETIEYDNKLVDQYNRVREKGNGPYAYRHIKKKKTITNDNDFELWLELQAMNCLYVIYHDEIDQDDDLKSGLFSKKKSAFEMPLEDYNNMMSKCEKILNGDSTVYNDIFDEMDDICQEYNLSGKDKERVKELYPYLYAFAILLNNDDVEQRELENIIQGFKKNNTEESVKEDLVVHESKTVTQEEVKNEQEPEELPKYRQEHIEKVKYREEQAEKPKIVFETRADEDIKIVFDNDYFNYRNGKYEGQEEGDYVYSNKNTGELICRENDNSLWLRLQAMNFINKLFKNEIKEIKDYNLYVEDDSSKRTFTVPEKETIIAIRMYESEVDEKELKTYLYGLCVKYSVKETTIEKVFELYPFFCAYVWTKSYGISPTKALVELKNIPKLIYDSQEEYEIEEVKKEEDKFIINFDKEYYKYKVAIMEDLEMIYCDEVNSTYISEENNKDLWLKLQAMNFVSKVYKLNDNEDFTLPEDLYINVIASYVNDEKITDEKLKSICEINKLSEKEYSKVLELYPYFCAYVLSEKNNLSTNEKCNIVEKVKGMLKNEENSFQGQEKTVVLNMPKNNEIIDKFLNRLNQ